MFLNQTRPINKIFIVKFSHNLQYFRSTDLGLLISCTLRFALAFFLLDFSPRFSESLDLGCACAFFASDPVGFFILSLTSIAMINKIMQICQFANSSCSEI